MWQTILSALMFATGLATGLAITWWRWKASLEILDRATEWRTLAQDARTEVASQKRYLRRLDETVGRLAEFVRTHLRVTTPAPLRSAVAKMVGESEPEKPKAGWEAPIPPFEEGMSRLEKGRGAIPRAR